MLFPLSVSSASAVALLLLASAPWVVSQQTTSQGIPLTYNATSPNNYKYQGVIPNQPPLSLGYHWFDEPHPLTPTPINTTEGQLYGLVTHNGTVLTYFGVPYAQPPIGALRFNRPQPPLPYSGGVKNATYPALACPQAMGFLAQDGATQSPFSGLDCLYMNIFVPSTPSSDPSGYPVWVFSPGGSNLWTGYQDGSQVVAKSQQVVQVYLPYRVNVEGYLSIQGASNEHSPVAASGNWGLLDAQQGLRWIQQNIAAFGGNPNAVTFGGQSAGSQDTCLHLVSPLSAGLFRGAIPQSGGCDTLTRTLAQNEAFGQQLAAQVRCSNATYGGNYTAQLECLRQVPWEDLWIGSIVANGGAVPQGILGPIVDGYVILQNPIDTLNEGPLNGQALLTGSNGNEYAFFSQIGALRYNSTTSTPPSTPQGVEGFIGALTNNNSAALAAYSLSGPYDQLYTNHDSDPLSQSFQLAENIVNAGTFWCQNHRMAQYYSRQNKSVYEYQYHYVPQQSLYANIPPNGAAHASELACVFYSPYGPAVPNTTRDSVPVNPGGLVYNGSYTPSQAAFCSRVSEYWVSFVHTLNPNNHTGSGYSEALPYWPMFNTSNQQVQELGSLLGGQNETISTIPFPYSPACQFWDQVLPPRGQTYTPRCAMGYTLSSSNQCVPSSSNTVQSVFNRALRK